MQVALARDPLKRAQTLNFATAAHSRRASIRARGICPSRLPMRSRE